MPELNLSQPIARPSDRRSLTEGILDGTLGVAETTWLEWKSQVDWDNPVDVAIKVARHVIGFANRDPVEAQGFAGGEAYLVFLADAANPSMSRIDPADIENKVSPYLGTDGPQWSSSYVDINGSVSLLITVAPPRAGDHIHSLRKQADKYRNGTVFVRRPGKTEVADSTDVRRLELRAQGGASQIAIEVGARPNALRRLNLDKDIEAFVQAEQDRLLGPLSLEEARVGGGQAGVLESLMGPGQREVFERLVSSSLGAYKERRRPSEFRAQCEMYFHDVAAVFKESAQHVAALRGLGEVELRVTNPSARNLIGVEVELFLPVGVLASRGRADEPDHLPKAPLAWGQDTLIKEITSPSWTIPGGMFSPATPAEVWYLGSGHGLVFDDVDVRPFQTRVLPPVHLFWTGQLGGGILELPWRATAKNTDNRAEGLLTFVIDEADVTLNDLLGGSRKP
jgi:hypothetical protein